MFCVGGSGVDDVKAAASQCNVATAGDIIAVEVKRDALVLRGSGIAVIRTSVGRGRTCVDEQAVRERNILQQGDGVTASSGGEGIGESLVLRLANLGDIVARSQRAHALAAHPLVAGGDYDCLCFRKSVGSLDRYVIQPNFLYVCYYQGFGSSQRAAIECSRDGKLRGVLCNCNGCTLRARTAAVLLLAVR